MTETEIRLIKFILKILIYCIQTNRVGTMSIASQVDDEIDVTLGPEEDYTIRFNVLSPCHPVDISSDEILLVRRQNIPFQIALDYVHRIMPGNNELKIASCP